MQSDRKKQRILLVEDDIEISEMLKGYLETEQYEVLCAADGREACRLFDTAGELDLVLLDLMIPEISGMDVMGYIRQKSVVPVMIVSAKDSETDKTLGLALGADDYITKPFSLVELTARIKANIRRAALYSQQQGSLLKKQEPVLEKPALEEVLSVGDLTMNLMDFSVTRKGEQIELTAKEFEILKLLLKHPKRVYTKEQIYSLVWNDAYYGDENAVNVHISRLRNKLEEDSRHPTCVVTVWGIGYKLGDCT